jgi:hypothetical protein
MANFKLGYLFCYAAKLQDASVTKVIEETTIKGKKYDVIKVTLVKTVAEKILMMNTCIGSTKKRIKLII